MPQTGITAKYPAALATLANIGGPHDNFAKLTLSGAHSNVILTVTVTTAIPAQWPQVGFLTIDTEIIEYASWAGSTFTIADLAHRGVQNTVAAAHADQSVVARRLTEQHINQIMAEVIAMETFLGIQGGLLPYSPNMLPNSDFTRRTSLQVSMMENFTDANGFAVIAGAPTVAGNTLTHNAAGNAVEWPKNQTRDWFRDLKASVQFKAVAVAGQYQVLVRYIDGNNYVSAFMNGAGNAMMIRKRIAGVNTDSATVGVTLTLNNWYWIEMEVQGTSFIFRIYNSGAAAAAKSAATLLNSVEMTVADAAVAVGGFSITSDQATSAWGGIGAAPGGIYLETYMPENWTISMSGTLGGQVAVIDEAVDAGPIGKQIAGRYYNPHSSRGCTIGTDTADGTITPSVSYAGSIYMKTAGYGGAGNLLEAVMYDETSALGSLHLIADLVDAAVTVWTRKTASAASAATGRRAKCNLTFGSGNGGTATGTCWFSLPQLELGAAATPWRPAPGDSAPLIHRWTQTNSIVNSTVEQALFRKTIKGGTMGPNGALRLRIWGDFNGNSGGPTINLRIKFGATTIMATGAFVQVTSTARTYYVLEVILENVNSVASQRTGAWFSSTRAEFATTPLFVMALSSTPTWLFGGGTAPSTEDTSTDKDLVISGQIGTAGATIDLRVTQATLEVIPG